MTSHVSRSLVRNQCFGKSGSKLPHGNQLADFSFTYCSKIALMHFTILMKYNILQVKKTQTVLLYDFYRLIFACMVLTNIKINVYNFVDQTNKHNHNDRMKEVLVYILLSAQLQRSNIFSLPKWFRKVSDFCLVVRFCTESKIFAYSFL